MVGNSNILDDANGLLRKRIIEVRMEGVDELLIELRDMYYKVDSAERSEVELVMLRAFRRLSYVGAGILSSIVITGSILNWFGQAGEPKALYKIEFFVVYAILHVGLFLTVGIFKLDRVLRKLRISRGIRQVERIKEIVEQFTAPITSA